MKKFRELRVSDELPVALITDGDLFLSDGKREYMILPADVFVPENMVEQLNFWNIETICTNGEGNFSAQDILLEKGKVISFDSNEDDEIVAIKKFYLQCVDTAQSIFREYKEEQSLPLNRIIDLLHEIIQTLKSKKRFLLRLSLYNSLYKDYCINHALQTTILSLCIGDSIKLPSHRLIDLGIASLLHEIGFFSLPSNLYEHKGKLSHEEERLVSSHVAVGYKILKSYPVSPDVLLGVLQYREYMDGTGYLQGLSGEKISLCAKIIGITSFYHEQITDRPYRKRNPEYLVLASFIKNLRKKYDENLVNSLISNLSLFPIGSRVKLSDGSTGIVVDVDPEDIRHPIVNVTINRDGSLMGTKTSAVKLNSELFVAGVLTGTE